MKIVLLENFKLGKIGDIVKVKNGYAKNFIFPNKKGLNATSSNIEKIKCNLINNSDIKKNEEIKNSKKLNNINIIVPVSIKKNEEIYGSFNSKRLSKILKRLEINLNIKTIEKEFLIKKLGTYKIVFKNKKFNSNVELYVTLLKNNK